MPRRSGTGGDDWLSLQRESRNPAAVLAMDDFILQNLSNWFVREVLGMIRRTFARLEVSSRSMYALVRPGSCFAGTLLEVALASDRCYMLDLPDAEPPALLTLSAVNFGALPRIDGASPASDNGND